MRVTQGFLLRGSFRRCAAGIVVALLACGAAACQRSASQTARGPDVAPASSRPTAGSDAEGYSWTPAERRAVEDFLRSNPQLRVATDGDRRAGTRADAEIRSLYGIYHPYFVRGDLNDDGILDFALAFVRRGPRGAAPWFSVAIFTGRDPSLGGAAFEPGMLVERDVALSRGDLSIDRDAILVTPDTSDEAVRRYRWDPSRRSYVFVRDDFKDVETPEVSTT